TISVTYSNPVTMVALANNNHATETSPAVFIPDSEADVTEQVLAAEQTNTPMNPTAEGADKLSSMASQAWNSDSVEASQSEASEIDASLNLSEETYKI
ncbi:hypothetical protein ACJMK2_002103, partial [Sinanodonta woodiana]